MSVHDESWSWMDDDGVLYCAVFNVVNQGMCNARLDDQGECPRRDQHGWSS